jgi:hypothetical protein
VSEASTKPAACPSTELVTCGILTEYSRFHVDLGRSAINRGDIRGVVEFLAEFSGFNTRASEISW